ncbi:MAG: ArsR family transcriptional regulator [Betaproteobacteria bacterium]|jgi:DNA-binding transcriptional ArsR family regulator|nr:ArsR family transcriptional regulator [Nitrosomonadales bacterium]NCX68536.1 ArsR family transcriptional regulator [Betaproteobacteria bacterium]
MSKCNVDNVDAIRNSASQACSILKLLANEDRLMLLCQLTQGEKNVGELESATNIQQPTLSQQLTILRKDGIVAIRKDGKFNYYSIASDEVIQVMQTLGQLYGCNRS